MPEISVIIPVYNTEKYLDRCVNSIIQQSMEEIEIILVDDGSSDSSSSLIDQYVALDSRIIAVHKKNEGHAASRNKGLDLASYGNTHWITFVDSDDWIDHFMLESLFSAAQKSESKLSVCGYARVNKKEEAKYLDNVPLGQIIEPEEFWCKHRINATIPCGKLYDKNMFIDKRWPLRVHDDEAMTYKLLFREDQIVFINEKMYFYFYNAQSVMASNWSPQRVDSVYAIEERRKWFISEGFNKAAELDTRLYIEELYNTLCNFEKIKDTHKATYNNLMTRLRNVLYSNRRCDEFSWKNIYYIWLYAFPILKVRYYFSVLMKKIGA